MMICPKCGNENPDGSVFCESCGKRVVNDMDYEIDFYQPIDEIPIDDRSFVDHPGTMAVSPDTPVCPECGSPIYDDTIFCENCGTKVGAINTPPPPAFSPGETVRAKPLCPTCGAEVDDDCVFCEGCGTRIAPFGGGTSIEDDRFAPPPVNNTVPDIPETVIGEYDSPAPAPERPAFSPSPAAFSEAPAPASAPAAAPAAAADTEPEPAPLKINLGKSRGDSGKSHQNSKFKALSGFDN